MGFGPQLVDLDGDGQLDIVSGSWPGEIFFFKGNSGREFADPVKLKNKDGKTINIGGGRRKDSDGMILIAGDATFEKDEKGNQILVYEGEKISVPEGQSAGITGTASSVFAVDWNNSGKLDLLVGDIGGSVYLVPNEGNKTAYAFGKERALEADGKVISAPGGDAGPIAADWDGDGKLDLIVGCGDGSVVLYRNTGTREKPELAAGVQLVAPGSTEYGPNAPKEPVRGIRAKVCVADLDGDGRLDLLVGDFATQKPDLPEPTPEQKAEHDKLRKELEETMKRYPELISKIHGSKRIKDKAEREKAEKEFNEVMQKMSSIRAKLPEEYTSHGWVWFFKRKPA